MLYPESLTYSQLSSHSDEYAAKCEEIEDIQILFSGGRKIWSRREEYLPKRLDETPELYALRRSRFTYTNILAKIVNRLVGRFSQGKVQVDGLSPMYSSGWEKFRANESKFICDILRDLILNQAIYIQVDRPSNTYTNLAQEIAGGDNRAWAVAYDPRQCLSQGEDWYKFVQHRKIYSPIGEPFIEVTWKIIDAEHINIYQSRFKSKNGNLVGKVEGSQIAPMSPRLEIPLISQVSHGFGQVPIVHFSVPDEKYAGGQIRLKSRQHIAVENALTDTSLSSGYVQRVLTPIPTAEDDYSVSEEPKSDNQHVVVASSFKFEEIQGSSIATNLKLLDRIEAQIEALVCMAGGDVTREAMVRSAASKIMDSAELEISLESYGSIITPIYAQVLNLVKIALGDMESDISVSGLTDFSLDNVESDLDLAQRIKDSEIELSPTAMAGLRERISLGVLPNASPAQKEQIFREITG